MQLWIKIPLFIALFLIVFSLIAFYMSIRPAKIVTNLRPSDLGLKYEVITFKSIDGVRLSGWFIPNENTKTAIIVMHGYPADKANLLGIAGFLAKNFSVFLFDFRSFGDSEGLYTTAGYLEKNDLLGAVEFLEKEKNITKIGIYGFSLGGAVALMSDHINIKAVVSDSAYAKLSNMARHMYSTFLILKYPLAYLTKLYGWIFLGLNIDDASPVDDIKNKKIPVLLIHSEKDSQIPVSEAYALSKANEKAELWIVEGADHGMAQSANPEEYGRKVNEFFLINIK
jgi:uncharacterized protein